MSSGNTQTAQEQQQAGLEYFQKYLDKYDLKSRGAGSQKDPATSRFSGLDVRHVFDHGKDKFDLSNSDAAQGVLDYWDRIRGTTKAGGKTRDALNVLRGYLKDEPSNAPGTGIGGSGPYSGAVNTIEGDGSNIGGVTGGEKNTVIYGDNNTVDHSNFQQYFGDEVRHFHAGKGRRGLYSSPVSDATMSGFYGTKDTGRTAAEFLAKYAGANETWQTRGDKNWKKNGNFDYTTDKYRAINPMAMQERIDRQPIIMRDRANLHYNRLYGDLDQYQAPDWMMPEPPEPIEDNVDEIAEDFRKDLG